MRKSSSFVAALAVVLSVIASTHGVPSVSAQSGGTVKFKAADLKVEINATDGDAGLQVFLDHEPWRSIAIARPNGGKILDITAQGVLRDYGLTELFSESSEPAFDEFPLEEFKKLFPEGRYTFTGETIDGRRLRSRVPLTHDFPAGPRITSPRDGSTVSPSSVLVRWEPVRELEIVAYQVVVTKEERPERVLEATVPNNITQFRVPSEFLERQTEFKAEVLAIEESGNQTLTEVTFTTA